MKCREDILVSDLCEEVDFLRSEINHYKNLYEKEIRLNAKFLNERLEESKRGVSNALMFCLSVQEQPDGSFTISKENRKELANNHR